MALGRTLGSLPAVRRLQDPKGSSRSLATSLWMLWGQGWGRTVPTPTPWLCSAPGCCLQHSGPGSQLPAQADPRDLAFLPPSCTSRACSNKGTSFWMQLPGITQASPSTSPHPHCSRVGARRVSRSCWALPPYNPKMGAGKSALGAPRLQSAGELHRGELQRGELQREKCKGRAAKGELQVGELQRESCKGRDAKGELHPLCCQDPSGWTGKGSWAPWGGYVSWARGGWGWGGGAGCCARAALQQAAATSCPDSSAGKL